MRIVLASLSPIIWRSPFVSTKVTLGKHRSSNDSRRRTKCRGVQAMIETSSGFAGGAGGAGRLAVPATAVEAPSLGANLDGRSEGIRPGGHRIIPGEPRGVAKPSE